jgi:hypothetical protein
MNLLEAQVLCEEKIQVKFRQSADPSFHEPLLEPVFLLAP